MWLVGLLVGLRLVGWFGWFGWFASFLAFLLRFVVSFVPSLFRSLVISSSRPFFHAVRRLHRGRRCESAVHHGHDDERVVQFAHSVVLSSVPSGQAVRLRLVLVLGWFRGSQSKRTLLSEIAIFVFVLVLVSQAGPPVQARWDCVPGSSV